MNHLFKPGDRVKRIGKTIAYAGVYQDSIYTVSKTWIKGTDCQIIVLKEVPSYTFYASRFILVGRQKCKTGFGRFIERVECQSSK